jgi:hypothetical protein
MVAPRSDAMKAASKRAIQQSFERGFRVFGFSAISPISDQCHPATENTL